MYWFAKQKCVANLRASDRSDANASELNVWNSSTCTKNGTRWRGGSAPRSIATSCKCETRSDPSKFDACSPIAPLARFAIRMRRLSIVNLRSRRGATCPRMSRRCGDAVNCPALFRIGAIASERRCFRVGRKLLVPEAKRLRIGNAARARVRETGRRCRGAEDRSRSRARRETSAATP